MSFPAVDAFRFFTFTSTLFVSFLGTEGTQGHFFSWTILLVMVICIAVVARCYLDKNFSLHSSCWYSLIKNNQPVFECLLYHTRALKPHFEELTGGSELVNFQDLCPVIEKLNALCNLSLIVFFNQMKSIQTAGIIPVSRELKRETLSESNCMLIGRCVARDSSVCLCDR